MQRNLRTAAFSNYVQVELDRIMLAQLSLSFIVGLHRTRTVAIGDGDTTHSSLNVHCTTTYMRYEYAGIVCTKWHARMVGAANDAETKWTLILGQHNFLQKRNEKKRERV